MLYFLYDLLLFLAVPILVPYYLYRYLRRGMLRKGMAERLGRLSPAKERLLRGGDTVWVHAVSVGETMAVRPLLTSLKSRRPDLKIVLSTVTETGRGVAETLRDVDLCVFFPLDFRFSVKRMLAGINPRLIVVVETEIWPNFLRSARHQRIPVVLANGRISDKSFGGYLRFSRIFRQVLDNFSALCMQTEEDARRIIAIGAPPSRVHVTRNLKYDIPLHNTTEEQRAELRTRYHFPGDIPVLTAGSTHQGEEEALLKAFRTLGDQGKRLILVLAPRHPQRAAEVAQLLERMGISHVRRSELPAHSGHIRSGEVLLVDTVGELMGLYSLSELVFVGGSLVSVGGHNILEPASLGIPVVFGPYMNNFREIATGILRSGGGTQVAGASDLSACFRDLLDSPAKREAMGRNGAALLTGNSGSTHRHMEIIEALLIDRPRTGTE